MALYPLRFKPRLKERIWGGESLAAKCGKRSAKGKRYGESWEISGVAGDMSVVSSGMFKGNDLQEMVEIYMGDLVGEKVYDKFGIEFPLLVKHIDTAALLSIQVHPDDRLAAERHNSYGKTEVWYVTECEPGASLYLGLKSGVTRAQYLDAVVAGTLPELLQKYEVHAGDAFFIPAGTIHAIGKGIKVVEIQQTSDITYRIFDWNRVDDNGRPRQLHTALAIDAIDFDSDAQYVITRPPQKNTPVKIVCCPYFTTNLLEVEGEVERDFSSLDSFVIYVCVEGSVALSCEGAEERLSKDDVLLVPAEQMAVTLKGDGTLLEVYCEY